MKKNLLIPAICLFVLPLSSVSAEEFRKLPVSIYIDKMKAGWIGQMAGVGWGGPTEFKWKGEIIPADKIPQWKPELINQFEQDDIYVEMTFLRTLEEYGFDVGIRQAGIDFANSQYDLAHANLAGRWNLRNGIAPPDSGHPKFNRHADDIDYQIEADFSGLICPGLGNEVIRLGEVFGRLMNYGDGLYGGQFVGGMYAEAFFEKDVHKIIQAGLDCVPGGSQFHECITDVIKWHGQNPGNWQKTWELIETKYQDNQEYRKASCDKGDFNIDAKINAAYIVMGMLYGEGDIDKTIIISTRCGQDSDCNPSNAAGILCTTIGYSKIPGRFRSALDPRGKFSHTPYNFDSLVAVCEKLTRQAVKRSGGRIERYAGGKEVFVIPNIETKPSKLEQCWEPGPIANSRFTPEEHAKLQLKITLSKSKMGLDDVVYENLEPGEFMRKWLVLGPMPYPGRDDVYIDSSVEAVEMSTEEQKSVFAIDSIDVVNFEPKQTISNTEYQWAVLEAEDNIIDLVELVKNDGDYKIAYLWAQIEMPQDRTCTLGIGADDGVKVWLNGELVHENWLIRAVTEDDDHVRVSFKKGKNQLVLKIQNGEGPWGFSCRELEQ
ncbi:MAG: ADP-ribosylglycohydrolase family protein [Planctomycetota bacterium]